MSQTLHIFRKDVRRFRYELCLLAALTAAFAWTHIIADMPNQPDSSRMLAYYTAILLPVAWWFLVSQLIHEESLAGDRQFWVTRPYAWRQLLSAKLLFILAFVNVPLLGAQVAILSFAGYSPVGGCPSLLGMQFAASVVLLMPVVALATVTRGLGQFIMSILGTIVCSYSALAGFESAGHEVLGTRWTNQAAAGLVVCAGAFVVLRWQYGRRLTDASLVASICTLLISGGIYVGMPRTVRWRPQTGEPISVSIRRDAPVTLGQSQSTDHVLIQFPVTITGVPAGDVARPVMTRASIDAWSSGWVPAWRTYPDLTPREYINHLIIPSALYRRIQGTEVTVHGSIEMSLRKQTVLALAPNRRTPLPEGGYCEMLPVEPDSSFCSSPFRKPYNSASESGMTIDPGAAGHVHHSSEELLSVFESPWPDFALSPVFVERGKCPAGCVVSFVREYPRAWCRRDFAATVRIPESPR